MSAWLSGVPWLLIEICARSLLYGCVGGVFHGPVSIPGNRGTENAHVAAQHDMAWVGIDVGKTHHWVCVVDADGKVLLSVKIGNDEAEVVALLAQVASLATRLIWAVDIIGAPSALLLALLDRAGQPVQYASGRVVAAMSAAYAGEGKTDAKDAYVIAETARLRRDLATIDADTDLVRNLAVLTGHRADLIADRVRMINRLRDLMTSVFPSLERAFDYSSHKGALVLITEYASPDRIRRMGQARLTNWLRNRNVRRSADVAARAVNAAKAQSVVLAGQELTASIIAELASGILALDERLKALDARIEETFTEHPQAAIIQSMPGFGPFPRSLAPGRRQRPARVPQRWPSRCCSRTGARPQRLRPAHRQPAPPTALQPPTAARLLLVRADQHDARRPQPRLLPEETSPRRHPQSGRYRSRPPPHRRALGTIARKPNVDRGTAPCCSRGLTTPLRFPVARHGPIRGLGGTVADGEHRPRGIHPGVAR